MRTDPFTTSPYRVYSPVVCFQSDGKLWVSDVATTRMLRFDADGLCDAWFMYTSHSYFSSVDPNDPKRVFWGFLEFEIDYSKPFTNSWTLKNYWGRTTDAGAPEIDRQNLTKVGLTTVTTLTNERTYALVWDPSAGTNGNIRRIVELTGTGLRTMSALTNFHPLDYIQAKGSLLSISKSGSTATFNRTNITGFSGNGDPMFSGEVLGTVNFTGGVQPISRSYHIAGTTNITFYPDKTYDGSAAVWPGNHLGAIAGGTWKWTNAPTATMNGRGNFDSNCTYAASHHVVSGGDIFFAYFGQSWRDGRGAEGLANQIFHYKLDGTFIGQFGLPSFIDGPVLNAPGAAGNIFHFAAVKTNGVTYLFSNDEGAHGLHRWRIDP